MKKYLILFFLSFSVCNSQTSKVYNNWYFPREAALTFSTSPPSFILNSPMANDEGCSTISDTLGNLLFYTDGTFVYDKNNNQMPNGFGLKGSYTSTQSGLIVPFPFNYNKYYIFTTDEQAGNVGSGCGCFDYSVVDMTLNGGLGDVTIKNTFLFDTVTEKLTAFKHSNDSCYWVVTHEWNTNKFFSYLITPTGVNLTPIISAIGSIPCCDNWNAIGQMKISPNGKKLGLCIFTDGIVELFDFNSSTGIVSNPITIIDQPNVYGLEFSPNSNLVYVSNNTFNNSYVFQIDISTWSSSSILASKKILKHNDPFKYFGQLQLAIDGKIYVANWYDDALSVINNPDKIGIACNFGFHQLKLQIGGLSMAISRSGLPNCIPGFYKTDYVPPDTDTIGILNNVPNVFTPNYDGVNDVWQVKLPTGTSLNSAEIYDRWGLKVFELNSSQLGNPNGAFVIWDGHTSSGSACSDGVYFYLINYTDKKGGTQKVKGYLSLFK